MRTNSAVGGGKFLLARLESVVKELGLTEVSCHLVPGRNVIELRWPHATLATYESVEVPVEPKWVGELIKYLATDARDEEREQLVSRDIVRIIESASR